MIDRFRIILKTGLVILALQITTALSAQEMWGIVMSNYAGSNGALLNPASILSSKLYMDINLVTFDIFADNNYLYIHSEDFKISQFLKKDPVFPSYGPDKMAFDAYSTRTDRKKAYVSTLIKGPSFMLARGRHAFAIHTGARVLTSIKDLPYHLANFGYFGLDYAEQHNINYFGNNFSAATLTLTEVGATYAYAFQRIGTEDLVAGITLKAFFSPGGGYVYGEDIDYIILNDSTANIKNLRTISGVSIPLDYDNNDFPDDGPMIKGSGFGVDLGVSYQKKVISYQRNRFKSLCSQPYIDYLYKIGFSLIDIGSVKFTQNAQVHAYTDVSRYWVDIDTLNYYNMNTLFRTLSEVFYGNPADSYEADRFSIFLPAAASLQVDYKVYKNFYAGGVFIYPLPLSKAIVHRPTQLALVPRYETPNLEFALPLSLYEWKYPRLGVSARFYFLTIGTDRLGSFLGISDFTGMDIYASIKLNFSRGKCLGGRKVVECKNGDLGSRKNYLIRK